MEREMLQKPKSFETENIVKANNAMTTANFVTLPAIKGSQFGKELFSAVIQFKDLKTFLEVFKEVQRDVNYRKVAQMKTYILSGIEEENLMRFFSAMTVTTRGSVFYNEIDRSIAIDTNTSKLSINDGQHRFYSISAAIEELKTKLNRTKDIAMYNVIKNRLESLENMVIPLVIFNGISEVEEKQLFFDLNNLAQRPSKNANIRLSQTDIISKLALDLSTSNKYLKQYGVEFNKVSIHSTNENFMLLSTVYAFIKLYYKDELSKDQNFINTDNYSEIKTKLSTLLSKIFNVLPKDINVKGKYILDRNFAFRGIAAFFRSYKNEYSENKLLEAISAVNWLVDYNYWKNYNAYLLKSGSVSFSGNGEGGVMGVKQACIDNLKE